MTPREKFEQRVSFVFGQQDHDKPGKSKDEIRRMLADSGGWPLDELTALKEDRDRQQRFSEQRFIDLTEALERERALRERVAALETRICEPPCGG